MARLSRRWFLAGLAALCVPRAAGADVCGPGEVKRRGRCYPATPTNTPPPTVVPPPATATGTGSAETATPTRTATSTTTPVSNWEDLGAFTDVGQHTCDHNTSNPNWARTIGNLTYWNGMLFLGYGDYSCNQPTGQRLLAYDPASGGMVDYGVINTFGLLDINALPNGQLAVPYTDPAVGTWPVARFVNADGTFEQTGNGPLAWHVYGSAYFNGKRYLSGAHYVEGSGADAKAVWRDDNGSWVKSDFTPNSYLGSAGRIYTLFVHGSNLYAVIGSTLYRTADGATWQSTGISTTNNLRNPETYGGSVYLRSGDAGWATGSLYRFNGSSMASVASSVWDHSVGDDGLLYYLTSTGAIRTANGTTVDQAPPDARSLAFIGGRFYVGTSAGHLTRSA